MVHSKRCPPGSLAWQQYQLNLKSGRAVTLGFSLGDPRDDTIARMKDRHRASHLGLLVVLELVCWGGVMLLVGLAIAAVDAALAGVARG